MPDLIASESLESRVAAFSDVMDSIQVTDRAGKLLDTEEALADLVVKLCAARSTGSSLYLAGNGGSAAVAAHAVTDFLNVGGLRAHTLHDSSLLTCMANDYGYESAYARILSVLAKTGDVLVTISSSGKSPNVCNAAEEMRAIDGTVITLTGFAGNNRLRSLGDLNFWLDSQDYGMVEIGHQFLLHNLSDRMPGKKQ